MLGDLFKNIKDFFYTEEEPKPGSDILNAFTPARKAAFPVFRYLLILICVIFTAAVPWALIKRGAAEDFVFIVTVMLCLADLVLFDILTRRSWEKKMAEQVRLLSDHHDRMVREVARNRNDVADLRQSLAKAAQSVEVMGRRHASPSSSIEAKMIETIVEQLGGMGEASRAALYLTPAKYPEDDNILEMELSPPPVKAPPFNSHEAEYNENLKKLDDAVVLELIRYAVRHDAIDLFLQPIVSLPQRKIRMFEVFGRIRTASGTWVPAGRFLELARQEMMLPALDNLMLLRCLQSLRARANKEDGEHNVPYILNIASTTLHDKGFMGDLVTFLSEHRTMASRLVFELSQRDLQAMDQAMISVMDGLSRLGCRFSMDGVRQRRLDINILKSRHIRFIKMDAAWMVKESAMKGGFSRLRRFKKQLDAQGIDLIVEKIENETILRELLDHSVDYGQGWLFGKPDLEGAWQADVTIA